jgi:hypothetical protein
MSASTYHSITCKTGKEYGKNQWKLIVRKFVLQVMRFLDEFPADVTLEVNKLAFSFYTPSYVFFN